MKLKYERCSLFLQAFFILLCLSFCSNQKINASVPELSNIEDVKEITLNIIRVNSTQWKCLIDPPKIEIDRRFRIRVKHVLPDKTEELLFNRIGRCNWWSWWPMLNRPNGLGYTSVVFTKYYNKDGLVSDILDVSTRLGGWTYECIFYFEYAVCDYYNGSKCVVTASSGSDATDRGISCFMDIRIPKNNRSQTLVGRLTANNKHFYPGPEYQDYRFYDGEGTNFTCHGTTEDYGQVKLNYYTKGVLNITNRQTDSVSMYMKLTADNNGDSLECVNYDQHHYATQIIRLAITVDNSATASSMWVSILAGVLGLGDVITVTVIIVRRCRGRPGGGGGGPGPGPGPASPPGDSPAEVNHEYETIDNPVYDVPYATSAPVAPAPVAPHDISDRDVCPLPEHPEDAKYLHYATPYEFRIFRPGFPAH